MTPLRSSFINSLELRGLAEKTRRNYVQAVHQFATWLGRSPATLTRADIDRYLLYLKRERKLAVRTLNIHTYGLKAFCEFMLPKGDIGGCPIRRRWFLGAENLEGAPAFAGVTVPL